MHRDNPFTLTFGKQPEEYIARYESSETVVSTFEASHPISQTYLIEGIRGSGKTVLMTAISKELESRGDWLVVDLNATQALLPDLAARLTDVCGKRTDILKSGFNVSFAGFGVGISGRDTPQLPASVIETLLGSLKKKRKKLLVTIDEVTHSKDMRNFASEFQLLVRKDLPVYLLMTGLYENIYAVQNDPALTFLLRAPKIRLKPLNIGAIASQYRRIFQTDEGRAQELASITRGYAFAFQALGMLYFEYRDTLAMDEILEKLDAMLDDFVYQKIWEGLSARDRAVLLAIQDQEVKVQELCARTGMTSATFSRYRDRLIKRGLVQSPRYGYLSLTLPRFYQVVRMYEY